MKKIVLYCLSISLFCSQIVAQNLVSGVKSKLSSETNQTTTKAAEGNKVATTSNTSNYIPSIIPLSPNAASLGKYVETPVGLYNGIPEISIPIYNVTAGGNNLPISLSYHAGGVKVSDIASNVGLGWTLNAGGVISRTIVGLPDGVGGNNYTLPFGTTCTTTQDAGYSFCLQTAIERTNDTEPDVFNYNFNGYSGKFVFNKNGGVVTMPHSNLKISPIGGISSALIGFTVTDESGTVYTFSRYESTLYDPSNGISTNNTPPYFTPSSWYLTEIKYPNTSDKITLEYYSNSVDYWTPISETYSIVGVQGEAGCYVNASPEQNNAACEQFTIMHNQVITKSPQNFSILDAATIKKISFPNGSIEFVEDGYRKEVRGYKSLEKIKILDGLSNIIKVFKLSHKYFSNSSTGVDYVGLTTIPTFTQEATQSRLFLTELKEYTGDELKSMNPYVFSYYIPDGIPFLPDRVYAKSIDHWGYYNGQINNSTLIPQRDYIDGIITGGNRNAIENYTKMGTLTEIKYPTGGITRFEYQQNMAVNNYLGYKNIIVPTLNYYLGGCHFGGGTNTFVIDDHISHVASVTISLSGKTYGFTPQSCGTGTQNVPILTDASTYIYLQIINVTNPSAPVVAYTTTPGSVSLPTNDIPGGSVSIVLPNGTYQIRAVRGTQYTPVTTQSAGFAEISTFSVNTSYYQTDNVDSKPAGGLCVKKIMQYDNDGTTLLSSKTFEYTDENGKTTGITNFIPEYKTIKLMCYRGVDTVYSSNSVSQNTGMLGSPVGYSKVTVKEINSSSQANGKYECFYSNPNDFVPYLGDEDGYLCYTDNWIQGRTNFPFGPNVSQDWRRGLLQKRIDYIWKDNMFKPIKELTNLYKDDFLGSFRAYSPGDAIGCRVGVRGWSYLTSIKDNTTRCPNPNEKYYFFSTQFYLYPSRIVKLIQSNEKLFDVN